MLLKKPKIINDEPVVTDNLDSHSKIADALLNLIIDSNGGKTIGLEGVWGSGKSSVIRILEANLIKFDNIHLYKFDAWTHQGEPLRRAFLEGLFDKILGTAWFQLGLVGSEEEQKWKSVKRELAQKIKMSTKTVTPELDLFGIFLILSFLCFPIGISILSSIIASSKVTEINLAIGSAIFLMPFLFLSITVVCVGVKNFGASDWKGKMQQVVAKFLQKGYATDVTRTSENLEPTTIEFQSQFKDFMHDALLAPRKRLVIVIDNLDRISDKEVEVIWPILRSFVDNPDFANENWFKRFWVIIPFAPRSLKPLTESKDLSAESKNSPRMQMGFLDKVIQINFHVPTPILSNLKKYISINLKEAFGENALEDKIHKIFIIISNEVGPAEEITPRLVVSVINNMVATALQWPTVNLVSHAYFSVLRRKSPAHEIAAKISSDLIKDVKYNGILPDSILLDLAVLSCNVEVSVAAQKLYGNDLENTLTETDSAKTLTKNYQKVGYAELMATLLAKNLEETAADPAKLTKKISNLLSVDFSSIQPEHRDHLLQDVRSAISKLSWIPIGSGDFLKIIKYLSCEDNKRFFLKSLVPVLRQTKNNLEANISNWYEGNTPSSVIFNWSHARKDNEVQLYFANEFSFETLCIPGPFDSWKNICNELGQSNALIHGFPPKLLIPDVYREIRMTNHYSQPVESLIAGCRSLEANGIDIPEEVIVGAFVSRINRQAERPLNEALKTLPFVIEKAASKNLVHSKLVSMEFFWVFYYLATIFSENPRRSKEADLPLLNPELPGNELAPTVIANLLFLWVIQGMNLGSENMENIYKQGLSVLRKFISSHPQELEILHRMRLLFSLNEDWAELISPKGIKRWRGQTEITLSFIRKFH